MENKFRRWEVERGGMATKGNRRNSYGDGTVLYLNCTNSNILLVRVYYSFARRYHWGKLDKASIGSLYSFLQLDMNLQSYPKETFN